MDDELTIGEGAVEAIAELLDGHYLAKKMHSEF